MAYKMAIVGVSAVALASSAYAGIAGAPELLIMLAINDEPAWQGMPEGEPTPTANVYRYVGSYSGNGVLLNWDMTADADPFITSNLSLTNNTLATQTFTLTALLPIAPAISPSSLMRGSVQGGLTGDGSGGTLASVVGSSIYQAIIDNGFVGEPANLLDVASVTVGPDASDTLGSDSFGIPVFENGPAVFTNIGIQLRFSLTPGDQASFTSLFRVEVPGPGTLGLLSVAGAVFAGRRRR